MEVAIVGAGPAGLSLAWFLKGTKYNATVYEALDDVGKKPCAWGLMSGVESLLPISKESIISEIKGFKIYLNDKLIHDIRERKTLGYIINKPLFLRNIAEKVDVKFNSKVVRKRENGREEFYLSSGEKVNADKVVISNGHYELPREHTVPAIQYLTDYKIDPEVVEFYFYSDLLGYAWVFPDDKGAKIGIGGYADVNFLKEKLAKMVKGKVFMFHGARVSDNGVEEPRLYDRMYVGEALGTVYPLTGEGIRPSILSSKIYADSLLEGKDFVKEFKSSRLYFSIQAQAKIIDGVKKNVISIGLLSKLITKSDPDLVYRIAIGDFTMTDLIKLFGRSLL
ncbi:NAD(P)/FAD-dependent oxidoreductase [Stygiolobus caldivivus]|uniref:FAD-dependent oxidoreductase n=1 Tax=Stygiolobus caldivivus TaxID=2824673 RepID=A0A8D5ZHY4_9CREN|nr:NAD(P)/FAD-dependent oxidoreductase [Stygiolobus caldivivus]BCU68985.1 FAD-dependent oxidoreductase [Stygiolobus caldivivus]